MMGPVFGQERMRKGHGMNEQDYLSKLEALWKKNRPSELPPEPHYPLGEVPLTDYLRHWARETPDRPCVIFYGSELTFGQLDEFERSLRGVPGGVARPGQGATGSRSICSTARSSTDRLLRHPQARLHPRPGQPHVQGRRVHLRDRGRRPGGHRGDHGHALPAGVADRDDDRDSRGRGDAVRRLPPEEPTLPVPDLLQLPARDCPGARRSDVGRWPSTARSTPGRDLARRHRHHQLHRRHHRHAQGLHPHPLGHALCTGAIDSQSPSSTSLRPRRPRRARAGVRPAVLDRRSALPDRAGALRDDRCAARGVGPHRRC